MHHVLFDVYGEWQNTFVIRCMGGSPTMPSENAEGRRRVYIRETSVVLNPYHCWSVNWLWIPNRIAE